MHLLPVFKVSSSLLRHCWLGIRRSNANSYKILKVNVLNSTYQLYCLTHHNGSVISYYNTQKTCSQYMRFTFMLYGNSFDVQCYLLLFVMFNVAVWCLCIMCLTQGCLPTVARAMVVNAAQLASYSQAKQLVLSTGITVYTEFDYCKHFCLSFF